MEVVKTAGGIIVEDQKLLLIRHKGGRLSFAKGHIEEGESPEEAALREVAEETGYTAKIVNFIGSIERASVERTGETVRKRIDLYKMGIVVLNENTPDEKPEWVNQEVAETNMQFPEEAEFLKLHSADLNS
jgi:8-oxo-dGTP pyrophosphatase MutT (NUDIX family)